MVDRVFARVRGAAPLLAVVNRAGFMLAMLLVATVLARGKGSATGPALLFLDLGVVAFFGDVCRLAEGLLAALRAASLRVRSVMGEAEAEILPLTSGRRGLVMVAAVRRPKNRKRRRDMGFREAEAATARLLGSKSAAASSDSDTIERVVVADGSGGRGGGWGNPVAGVAVAGFSTTSATGVWVFISSSATVCRMLAQLTPLMLRRISPWRTPAC